MAFMFPMVSYASENTTTTLARALPTLKDGYYVAVFVGYDNYQMQDKILYANTASDYRVEANPTLAVTGVAGNLTIGYGKYLGVLRKYYLGLELALTGSGADNDFQIIIPEMSFQMDTDIVVEASFGAALITGFRWNDATLVYLKLGYSGTLISIDETVRKLNDYSSVSVEYDTDNTSHGYLYGVGIDSMFNDQFSLRVEYTHASYRSFYADLHTKVVPQDNQFLLGLVYRFGK